MTFVPPVTHAHAHHSPHLGDRETEINFRSSDGPPYNYLEDISQRPDKMALHIFNDLTQTHDGDERRALDARHKI